MRYGNKQATAIDGSPMTENNKPITFSMLMLLAVITDLKDDDRLSLTQKRDIYRLKQKLALADGVIELNNDERTLIIERASKTLKIDAFGQVDDFLEHPLS